MNSLLQHVWDTWETMSSKKCKIERNKAKRDTLLPMFRSKNLSKCIYQELKTKTLYERGDYISFHDEQNFISLFGEEEDRKIVRKKIKIVHLLIYLLHKLSGVTFTNHICIYLTPFKKVLPKKNKDYVLGVEHVNSGMTRYRRNEKDNYIIVYRKEEWLKVLIHELLHAYRVDILARDNKSKLKSLMNYKEAYTECWAIILHCLLHSYMVSETYEMFCNMFHENIEMELSFSMTQADKVLHHMYLHYNALNIEHKPDVNISMIRNLYFKEDTNVFPYYILKLVLLFFYDEFIVFCGKKNKDYVYLTSPKDLLKFIEMRYKNVIFMDTIYNLPSSSRTDKDVSTLRMSLLKIIDLN
jgi:hypothetical protein